MKRNLLNQKNQSFLSKTALSIVLSVGLISNVSAQAVTEIITDYEGFWKSSTAANNNKRPVKGHNLLAFSYNGLRFSTGVDDLLLGAKGETYFATDFRALPVKQVSNKLTSNTKIGIGEQADGISNGPSNLAVEEDIAYYITDGKKGLDIGTGVANLPSGSIDFTIDSFSITSIGDGIPDILVTQIADPSGSVDKYEFLDASGKRVGNLVHISLNHISPVGNWTADFYEANVKPRVLTPGFTKTDRAIRLWAADFSDFGIDASNIDDVESFRINLSGNSDVAFVAYNHQTMNVNLPEQLKNFRGELKNRSIELKWKMVEETNLNKFQVEYSTDGRNFEYAGTVASGAAFGNYQFIHHTDLNSRIYYRLKIINLIGKIEYSDLITIDVKGSDSDLNIYPNPAISYIIIKHPGNGSGNQIIEIRNNAGLMVHRMTPITGSTETRINTSNLKSGIYMVTYNNGIQQSGSKMIIR